MEAKTCKASGFDKISNKLLKAAENTIIETLVYIFNLSPDEIKLAKVTPILIYAIGEKFDCGNCRPTSAISAVAKNI